MAEIKVQRRRSSAWLRVLLAIVAVAAILVFAFPRAENRTADEPAVRPGTSGAAAPAAPANPPPGYPPPTQ